MENQAIQVFENRAEEYDAWFDRYPLVYQAEILALRKFLATPARGLEIGVGTGRFARPLGIAMGVEPAPAMAELARRRGIKVIRGLAEALPFRPASFDLVLLVTVLCFFSDPFRSLAEAARVLRPGGQILVGMIDRDSPLGQSYEAGKQQSKFYRPARFYAVGQVLAWLTELGFQKPEVCQTLFQPRGEITRPEPVRTGYGAGGFAVITATR